MRRLLDAGIEVFASRGYHSARVDDIVKAARTSHGTFYLYFANKEDLFQALAHDVGDQMTALVESLAPIEPGAEGRRRLREWLDRFSEAYESCRPVIAAWAEAGSENRDAGHLGAELLTRFARTLSERAGSQDAVAADGDLAALAVVAMIERFHYYLDAGLVEADRAAALDALATVTHAALFPAGQAAEPTSATARG